jgi:hypothetical protein
MNFLNEAESEGGAPEFGEFTVRQRLGRNGARTCEFEELRVGDTVYREVSQPRSDPAQFDLWAYLVCPGEFSEAVAGTKWADRLFLRQTRVISRDPARLVWRLVVNCPVIMPSWSGFGMRRREFMLQFAQDRGQRQEVEGGEGPRPAPTTGGKRRHRR